MLLEAHFDVNFSLQETVCKISSSVIWLIWLHLNYINLSDQLDETCHHLEVKLNFSCRAQSRWSGRMQRIQASRDPNCPCWNSVHVTFDLCSVKENAGILLCLPHGVIIRAALLEVPQPWTCIKCAHVCIRRFWGIFTVWRMLCFRHYALC